MCVTNRRTDGRAQPLVEMQENNLLPAKPTLDHYLVTPVELLLVVAGHGIDHGDDGGFLPRTDVIKVEHALDGPSLHPPNHSFGLLREQRLEMGWRSWKTEVGCSSDSRLHQQAALPRPERLTIAVGHSFHIFQDGFRRAPTLFFARGASCSGCNFRGSRVDFF